MNDKKLKLLAKLWVATICIESDMAYNSNEIGLTEGEQDKLNTFIFDIGVKLSNKHPESMGLGGNVESLVKFVKMLQ